MNSDYELNEFRQNIKFIAEKFGTYKNKCLYLHRQNTSGARSSSPEKGCLFCASDIKAATESARGNSPKALPTCKP